jgi:hypothetical protein
MVWLWIPQGIADLVFLYYLRDHAKAFFLTASAIHGLQRQAQNRTHL